MQLCNFYNFGDRSFLHIQELELEVQKLLHKL